MAPRLVFPGHALLKPVACAFLLSLAAMSAHGQDAPTPAAAASASASSSSSSRAPEVVPPDKKILRKLTDAAIDYVRNQRGWMDGTYKVQFYGYDGGLTIMSIYLDQGDTASNFVGAEGQSFKVEIDPATMRVKSELY